jgi:hypothetical protein
VQSLLPVPSLMEVLCAGWSLRENTAVTLFILSVLMLDVLAVLALAK